MLRRLAKPPLFPEYRPWKKAPRTIRSLVEPLACGGYEVIEEMTRSLARGGRLERAHVALNFCGYLVFGHFEFIVLLHVHPEFRRGLKVACQPKRGVRSNSAARLQFLRHDSLPIVAHRPLTV